MKKADKTRRRKGHGQVSGWRLLVLAVLFGSAAVAVIARAAQLQLVEGQHYGSVAERQARSSSIIRSRRGTIRDRHGRVLALTVDVDSVFADPRHIENAREAAAKLAPVLGTSRLRLQKKLEAKRAFVYLKRRVDPEVARRIRGLNIRGVSTQPEPKRFYSNVALASHVLGFTDINGQGRAGVERSLDERLRGRSFEVPGLKDALGNRVFVDGFEPGSVLEGEEIFLTLDRQIQHVAEESLKTAVQETEAKAAVAIVLEPKTGEVLAMASYPTFNPNNLTGSTIDDRLNRTVSAIYEPGSTMKIVTVAAALEEKLIAANDRMDCEDGKFTVADRTIRDSNHAYGVLSIPDILKFSSNICAAKLGLALGGERLKQWVRRFGYGEKTGIRLPGELRGLLPRDRSWADVRVANVAFGQGLSATPLQMAQSFATIANGGVRVPARIIRSDQAVGGARTKGVRVVSAETAKTIGQMLVRVTEPGGTGTLAAIPGIQVAGKTGTAQKIDPRTRTYGRELYVASFAGFVPLEKPEAVIVVVLDEPRSSIYGGTVAAPVFRTIAKAVLRSRSIFPEDLLAQDAFLRRHQEGRGAVNQKPKAKVHLQRAIFEGARASADIDRALSYEAQALLEFNPKDENP